MPLTKYTASTAIISALSDLPNATDGLTAAQLKAKFDENPTAFKAFVNSLIDELESIVDGSSGADQIRATAIAGLTGTTVQALLESLNTLKATLASPIFTGTVVLPSTTSIGTVTSTEIGYLDNVTSSIQTQLNAKQALDATLTALAAFNTNGLMKQTSADTFTAVAAPTGAVVGDSDIQTLTNKSISGGQITSPVANVITNANLTGDVTSVGNATAIAPGVIVNADINAAAAIDASKIANGLVSNAEFQYLDGVTSDIQTQINNVILGQIPDGSITDAKLSDAAGQIKERFTAHEANQALQDVGGTGTAITITLQNFTSYTDNYVLTFIAIANNAGAATTININALGVKPVYKPNTTTAPNFIAGKAYTVWYDAVGGNFFIKASAEGTAVAGDVLAPQTFSNDSDTGITGTLALTGNAVDADVLATKTYYNNDAKTKRTGAMPNRAGDTAALASSVVGTTLKLRASNGFRDGVDDNVTITDPDFIAANIRDTVNLFGLPGTLVEGKGFATGTATSLDTPDNGEYVVTGLAFQPRMIYGHDAVTITNDGMMFADLSTTTAFAVESAGSNNTCSITSNGFRSSIFSANKTVTWYAWE